MAETGGNAPELYSSSLSQPAPLKPARNAAGKLPPRNPLRTSAGYIRTYPVQNRALYFAPLRRLPELRPQNPGHAWLVK